MRKTLAFLLALLLPFTAEAQEKTDSVVVSDWGLYFQNRTAPDTAAVPRFFPQGWRRVGKSWGMWTFGYIEPSYLEAVFGPYLDFWEIFSLGIAGGFESYPDSAGVYDLKWRTAGSLSAEKGRFSFEAYYENGGSREGWYRVDLMVSSKYAAVGGIAQAGDGFGPRLMLNTKRYRLWHGEAALQGWWAPLWKDSWRDMRRSSSLVGIELNWKYKIAEK